MQGPRGEREEAEHTKKLYISGRDRYLLRVYNIITPCISKRRMQKALLSVQPFEILESDYNGEVGES